MLIPRFRFVQRRLAQTVCSCRTLVTVIVLFTVWDAAAAAVQQEGRQVPSIEDKTDGMTHLDGFFDLYWDERTGKMYLEIDKWEEEFIYAVSLAAGLGSNSVGLDRGQTGRTHLIKAHRVGPTVLLIEPNHRYRARSADPNEVRAVEDAFAPSTHWGFEVAALTGTRVLVDATDFFMRDAHGIVGQIEQAGQGRFSLDRSRSTFYLPRTKAFQLNTEVETSLTFTSDDPGPLVRSTAASGEAITLRVHHSLVQLPDDGYTPRRVDPRVNSFGITFNDYAAPIDKPLAVRWIARHRIKKRDPNAERSRPVEPIVYYVDPGTPEPVRSALIEGGSWWNDGFEAAGFIDGFRVEVLPEGADPQDLRYNMIHWTHRSTRGWSYGSSIIDPRTGEIIKGNVNIGSLRLKQDFLLGNGMVPSFASGTDLNNFDTGPPFHYLAQVADNSDAVEMALARLRQLSAHEIGHTLGFSHNYAASTYGGRASVMDYPAPLVQITPEGGLDLSGAYAEGIGEFDKFAVKWAYIDFPPGTDEDAALEEIIQDAQRRRLRFLSDQDARPGGAHPLTSQWDNGEDPVAWLRHEMEVRRIGLESFSERVIHEGDPMASLEEVLVPLYLHHRYQVESAAKSIGGADYVYAVRGDGRTPITIVPPVRQLEALDAVLETIAPEVLTIPERILQMIPPRAFGMTSGETFTKRTTPTFDPLGAAASAAEITLGLVFLPERMARLIEFHSRDERNPSLETVIDRVLDASWRRQSPRDTYQAEVQRTVQRVALDQLIEHAGSSRNTPQVRATLNAKIAELAAWLESRERDAHQQLALEDIRRWQARPEGLLGPSEAPTSPQGSPIGNSGK